MQPPQNQLENLKDLVEHDRLSCLICGDHEETIMPEYPGKSSIDALLAHIIELHSVTQEELASVTIRFGAATQASLPDGRPCLLGLEWVALGKRGSERHVQARKGTEPTCRTCGYTPGRGLGG